MKLKFKLILIVMISNALLFIKAQQVNTLYFMNDVPVRHFLNPSFQPETDFYLSLPVIGFTQFGISNNSLTFKDIIFKENGSTVSFLNNLQNEQRFYNTLKTNTLIRTGFQTNLLSFGFRHKSAYWTFSLTEKADGGLNIPKSVVQLSLFGTPNLDNNVYNFTKTESNVSIYTEAAMGYSKQLNDKWRVGVKLKMLLGSANVSNSNNKLILEAGPEKWSLNGSGDVNYSGPVQLNIDPNYQTFSYTTPANISDWLARSGLGAGIDAGFEYRYNKKIKLSAAITDLGFIHWSKNVKNNPYSVDYSFKGITLFDNSSTITTFQDIYNKLILQNDLTDSIKTEFRKSSKSNVTSNQYTTSTTAKINLGFEYEVIKDKISIGLLSYSQVFKSIVAEEITASVNTRPTKWLDATVSYSLFNSRLSSIGAGIGLKTGIFHWFLASDYIPYQIKTLNPSDYGSGYPNLNIPIPYHSTSFNISVGMNLILNKNTNLFKGLHQIKKKQDCNCEWK